MPTHDSDAHKASRAFVLSCLLHYCTLLISSLVFSVKCIRPEMLLIKIKQDSDYMLAGWKYLQLLLLSDTFDAQTTQHKS